MGNELNQDQDQEQATDVADTATDELTLLKQRATLMNISFSNNIKVETLRAKIAAKMGEDDQADSEDDDEQNDEDEAPLEEEVVVAPAPKKSKLQTLREEQMGSQLKLVRCRIANLDPKKKDLPGEIFTIANEYIGTVRKYVPYGEVTDDGYHIPFCIYTDLEARRFQNIRTTRDRRTGQTKTETSWQKEFSIEILPPLTEQELAQLAHAQQAAGSVDGSSQAEYMS